MGDMNLTIKPGWLQPSEDCYKVIRKYEDCELKAYKCPRGIWTIGWGNTQYANGKPVKQGDIITQQEADDLLPYIATKFAIDINQMVKRKIRQHEFDALVSFVYNVGVGAFQKSTLLQKVNKNATLVEITKEFNKWKFAGGKVLNGLVKRRATEAHLYVSGKVVFDLK